MAKLPDDGCMGCSLCANLCPVNSIQMKNNAEGFFEAKINNEVCLDCKICENNCILTGETEKKEFEQKYFVYSNNNKKEKELSTSGGAFYKLAQYIINDGGYVFGAVLNSDMTVKHICSDSEVGISAMRGSKYVQSDISTCFDTIKKLLDSSKTVMFSGTPCQCDAINQYLCYHNCDTSKLILCDIVCHGVVSPMVFKDYIKFCETISGKKIVDHKFRIKINGWHNHTEENVFSDGTADNKSAESQLYKKVFHSHMAQRKSCHQCKYADINRVGDLTLADCWGIEKFRPEIDDNTGLSLLLVNSEKGEKLLSCLSGSFLMQLNRNEIMQPQLKGPAKISLYRNEFWKCYKKNGFKIVVQRFFGYGKKGKIYLRIFKINKMVKRAFMLLKR